MTTPTEPPSWAFVPDQDVHCPECDVLLSGLYWITASVERKVRTIGMSLLPCGHVLDMPPWSLEFRGRAGNGRVKKPSLRKGSTR